MDVDVGRLRDAERSSAAGAADMLLKALGWSSGGLHSAAEEIVKQRDTLRAEVSRLREERADDGEAVDAAYAESVAPGGLVPAATSAAC